MKYKNLMSKISLTNNNYAMSFARYRLSEVIH